jgi:mannosyltransferase OCH1-like enzyme
MVYESDIYRYSNRTFIQRRRIPLIIHQTYETHHVPSIWNSTVNSVIEKNFNDFKYRRWSHVEMAEFVKSNEPEFYFKTYIKYKYEMQRIDSFRYVLMHHLGGIYIDMDNGCNRPFKDLINTLESLDPDAIHLAAFPRRESFGVESDFLISSIGHPLYRQLISRLHLFNHNYILHFWTMLISAGPIYVSIQERLFTSSRQSVVRLLDFSVFRPMFIRKENGFTWIRRDAHILFYLDAKSEIIFWYCKIFLSIFILFILIKLWKQNRKEFSNLFIFIIDKVMKKKGKNRLI